MLPETYIKKNIKTCFNCKNRAERIGSRCLKHDFWPDEIGFCDDWKNKNVR